MGAGRLPREEHLSDTRTPTCTHARVFFFGFPPSLLSLPLSPFLSPSLSLSLSLSLSPSPFLSPFLSLSSPPSLLRLQVQDTIDEIDERHAAMVEIERGLLELHQIFVDFATVVAQQAELMDNIEKHVETTAE